MTIALYLRLSSEDNDVTAESESISNHRDLLLHYIHNSPDLCSASVTEFCDDGWSGKNFDRPAVKELLERTKRGEIQCILVKDLSRFGRDYITVGNYITRVFPFLNVRFIAVNDNFDSSRREDIYNLDTSFRALIYDIYSRDESKKVKTAKRLREQEQSQIEQKQCGFEEQIRECVAEQKVLSAESVALYESFVDSALTHNEYIRQKSGLVEKLEQARRKETEIRSQLSELSTACSEGIMKYQGLLDTDSLTQEQVCGLLERVTIFPEGRMEIKLRFVDENKAG